MATIAVFLVLGGGTAVANVIITSNSQVGPNTISGHKAFAGTHANLIGGSINGQDVAADSLSGANIRESSLTGDVQKLIYNADAVSSPGPPTTIAKVGPYTIKGQCLQFYIKEPDVSVSLHVRGPAGSADLAYSVTQNDSIDGGNHSRGLQIPANTDTQLASIFTTQGNFVRASGTVMLKSFTPTLVQVQFNAVADRRSAPGSCFIYGTATVAT